MGGRAVPKGVDRSPLRDTTLCKGRPQGVLHAVAWHGCCGSRPALPPTAWSRNEPDGMAVGLPVLAQSRKRAQWQRHRAILGAVATAHVDAHPGTINIGDLKMGAFLQPEAVRVNGGQADPIAQEPDMLENT